MQDAMTIWDSICHSQWFKQTSIVGIYARIYHGVGVVLIVAAQILFLNKNDLFEKKVQHSDIKNFFPVRTDPSLPFARARTDRVAFHLAVGLRWRAR